MYSRQPIRLRTNLNKLMESIAILQRTNVLEFSKAPAH